MDCIESAAVEFEDPSSSVDVDRLLHMSEFSTRFLNLSFSRLKG